MGLFSNRISREKLQLGDHIYAYRNGRAFSHHGIYVGEDRVIHFTAGSGITESESESMKSKSKGRCGKCGLDPNTSPGGVLKTCVDCFLKGHGLFLFEYGVPAQQFEFKMKGTCSTAECFAPDQSVKCASDIFIQGKGFDEYNLLENNCESFAAYCKRGKRVTEQGLDALSVTKAMTFGASIAGSAAGSTSSVPSAPPSVFKQIASFVVPKVVTYITSRASSSSR